MGVIYTREVEGPAVIGAWEIREETDWLLAGLRLGPAEMELFSSFRTDNRRRQWLAYRLLLRQMTAPHDLPILYDEAGKPYLTDKNWHVSVTHTDNFAGVILSEKVRVGIDMEKVRPRIDKVKEKFLGENELNAIPKDKSLDYLTLAWCAKEALYKLYGFRSLDFRENMMLRLPGNLEESCFYGRVLLHGKDTQYKLFQERQGDLFTVWVAENFIDEIRG
jgi:phosphopantetheinyl transferase